MKNSFTYPMGKALRNWRIWIVLAVLCLQAHSSTGQGSASFLSAAVGGMDTTIASQMNGEYYDEVAVSVNVPRIGSIELQAVIFRDEVYLPIKELFDFLRIRNTVSPDFDLVQGSFIFPENNYFIDYNTNRIVYKFKTFELQTGKLIRTESNLYLHSSVFGQVFDLDCRFDFRNLAVNIFTKLELPAIREMQQELMRRNIGRLKGEKKADTIIGRSFPLFNLSTIDWNVSSTQQTNVKPLTRLNFGLGGVIAGGELNLGFNYASTEKPAMRQQFYQWRFVNNNNRIIRQVSVGKLYPQTVSSILAPVIGVQVTNTPSTYRKSFGTFTVSNRTEPGWTVELYVNNVLINYTTADASGFYTFEVPMVYGSSLIKLRFYGPWGEEQMSEKYITVPFNFIPLNQFEYTVSGGVVENDQRSKFTRISTSYGLARRLTVGGGVEYVSTTFSGKTIPFVQATLVVGSHLLVSAEQSHGARTKLAVNYRLPGGVQADLSYTRFAKGQTAVNVNHSEERKLILSVPVKGKRFNAFSRLTVNQFTYPFNLVPSEKETSKQTTAEYLFSATVRGVVSNLTTYAVFNTGGTPLVYSNLSVAMRLPKGFRISQQAQYEYRRKSMSMVKAEIEKTLSTNGFLSLAYHKDFVNHDNSMVTLGLKYNFSFAQTFFSVSRKRKATIATQSARGSVVYNNAMNRVSASNQSQNGKGSIAIVAFLDLNNNGKKESNEPRVPGLKLNINGGRLESIARDTMSRVTGLEAYSSYYVEADKNSLEQIAWVIRKPVIRVEVDPNLTKLVEIPVSVIGEVSGTVQLRDKDSKSGLARIIINIHDDKGVFVVKVLSESDGYYTYTGLAAGNYIASVDQGQAKNLKMVSSSPVSFAIVATVDGDIVSGIDFHLQAK